MRYGTIELGLQDCDPVEVAWHTVDELWGALLEAKNWQHTVLEFNPADLSILVADWSE